MARRLVAILGMALGLLLLGGPAAVHATECEVITNHGGGGCGGGGGGTETLTRLWLEGFVDVPSTVAGETLALPLGPADPAIPVILNFGIPVVQVEILITPDTRVKNENGHEEPVELTDGDRVQLHIQVVGDVLWARWLRVEEFPELKLQGVAQLAADVSLPLAPGDTASIQVRLGGSTLTLPVILTSDTKLKPEGGFTLQDGDLIQVKAIVNNLLIVAVKLEQIEEN